MLASPAIRPDQGAVATPQPIKSAAPKGNPFEDFVHRYQDDPVLFVQEIFGATPDPWQAQLLEAIASGYRRISVRSGHGVGKTTAAAWAALWFLLTRYKCKIVVTAPTTSQLYDALYPEILFWISQMNKLVRDLLEVQSERIETAGDKSSFLSIRTSRAEKPDALQGVHSDAVMLIGDEASGIPEAVFEAAAGSMSGHTAVTLLLGNPVRATGYFYKTHYPDPDIPAALHWKTFHVSCIDSPRVNTQFIEEIKATYGEESNAYRVRVLGEFPRTDDNAVIPRELIEAAKFRDVVLTPSVPMVWGLDVARFGSDSSALVKRRGNIVPEPARTWRNLDLMQLTGAVVAEYEAQDKMFRPVEILVDSIGLGAGVVDRLREMGYPARGINVSESPAMGQMYMNLRSELWMKAKAWFERRDCQIPNDTRLIDELAAVGYDFTPSNKLKIDSKDVMRKKIRRSPDVADAFVLTFASDAITAQTGSADTFSWKKPFRRAIKGIV